jgi:hypothetical protein
LFDKAVLITSPKTALPAEATPVAGISSRGYKSVFGLGRL